jgi:hypothetical protein
MKRNQLGLAAAATALAMLASGAAFVSMAKDAEVKCAGVNSCKGTSECKTATNECKGLNGCKAEGWVSKPSAEACSAAGGKVIS